MSGRALGGMRGTTDDRAPSGPGRGTGSPGSGPTGTGGTGSPGCPGWLGCVVGEQEGDEPVDGVPVSVGDTSGEPPPRALWSAPGAADPTAPVAPVSAPPAARAKAPDPAGAAGGGELAGELVAGAASTALR
jgi:hypothetical protein